MLKKFLAISIILFLIGTIGFSQQKFFGVSSDAQIISRKNREVSIYFHKQPGGKIERVFYRGMTDLETHWLDDDENRESFSNLFRLPTDFEVVDLNGEFMLFTSVPLIRQICYSNLEDSIKSFGFNSHEDYQILDPTKMKTLNDSLIVVDKKMKKITQWKYSNSSMIQTDTLPFNNLFYPIDIAILEGSQNIWENCFVLDTGDNKLKYYINGEYHEFYLGDYLGDTRVWINAPSALEAVRINGEINIYLTDDKEGTLVRFRINQDGLPEYVSHYSLFPGTGRYMDYSDIEIGYNYDRIFVLEKRYDRIHVFNLELDYFDEIRFRPDTANHEERTDIAAIDIYRGSNINKFGTTLVKEEDIIRVLTTDGAYREYAMTYKNYMIDRSKPYTFFFNPKVMSGLDLYIQVMKEASNESVFFQIEEIENRHNGEGSFCGSSVYITPQITGDKAHIPWDGMLDAGIANEGVHRIKLLMKSDEIQNPDSMDAYVKGFNAYRFLDYVNIMVDHKLDLATLNILNNPEDYFSDPAMVNKIYEYIAYIRNSHLKENRKYPYFNAYLDLITYLAEIKASEYYTGVREPEERAVQLKNPYSFMINYKNLEKPDIEVLAKSPLNILSANQGDAAAKISELSGGEAKNFGYVDGAGVSKFEPSQFYFDETQNTAYLLDSNGDVIHNSAEWFIRDGNGDYCTYWNGTGYMMHVSHPEYRNWFFENRVGPLMDSFDGIFLDDVWSNVYNNLQIIDGLGGDLVLHSNTSSDWLGGTWLTDYSAQWEAGNFAGSYLVVNGKKALITGNSENVLWIADSLITDTGAGIGYEIIAQSNSIYQDQVVNWLGYEETYAESMTAFLGELKQYLENLNKELILNMWLERKEFTDDYANNADYIVNEALTHTWNMNNFVTKQYMSIDFWEAKERYEHMLEGHSAKLITIAYPYNNQSYFELMAANALLSPWDDYTQEPRGLVAATNVNISQYYHDDFLDFEIGKPLADLKVETYTAGGSYLYREFEGGTLFYNPERFTMTISGKSPVSTFISYPTKKICYGLDDIVLPPRSAALIVDSLSPIYTALLADNPWYTKRDDNLAFVVFTQSGADKVGTNSIWIEGGYSNNKNFIFDGSGSVPEGDAQKLFHAGNGADSFIETGSARFQLLGTEQGYIINSESVYLIPRVYDSATWAVLEEGIDFDVITRSINNATLDGNATWQTEVQITNRAYFNRTLSVWYFDKSVDSQFKSYWQREHGVLYRDPAGTALFTGNIDQNACSIELVEGIDYFFVPEKTLWSWHYREPVTLDTSSSITINTKDLDIQWGDVDPESMILVDSHNTGNAGEFSGKSVTDQVRNISIRKPRILVYGFREKVREGEYGLTILPENRVANQFSIASLLKRDEGYLYDRVVVTGDYSEFGSIDGFLNSNENDIGTYNDLTDYFDLVIITDVLQELPGREFKPTDEVELHTSNMKYDYESWLTNTDYYFMENYDGMIIDKSGGLRSFLYTGLHIRVWNIPGMATNAPDSEYLIHHYQRIVGSSLHEFSDKMGITDITGEFVESTDYQLLSADILGITDNHFEFGETASKWDNGGSFACYIAYGGLRPSTGGGYHQVFAIERSSGYVSGVAYQRTGLLPNVFWLGITYEDIRHVIKKIIGTTITFENISGYAPDDQLYLYFSEYSDKLDYHPAAEITGGLY